MSNLSNKAMLGPSMAEQRVILTRLLCLLFFFIYWIRWLNHLCLSQITGATFTHVQADNSYWLFHLLNIPQFLLSNYYISLSFDCFYSVLILLVYIRPNSFIYSALFFVLQSVYFITFHSAMTHHAHQSSALPFLAFLLCFKENLSFVFVLRFLRYYVCFIFLSAALWKITRGTFASGGQMEAILRVQHVDYLAQNSETNYGHFIGGLIKQGEWVSLLWPSAILLQFSFIVGFFTRRLDKFLLLFLLAFLIMDYYIMGLNFGEFAVWGIVFVTWHGFEPKD